VPSRGPARRSGRSSSPSTATAPPHCAP
jgi:hypothetical protein